MSQVVFLRRGLDTSAAEAQLEREASASRREVFSSSTRILSTRNPLVASHKHRASDKSALKMSGSRAENHRTSSRRARLMKTAIMLVAQV
eukprot:scaffold8416_cov267-Pinguiococcus_pyrenoidosus.AAC.7